MCGEGRLCARSRHLPGRLRAQSSKHNGVWRLRVRKCTVLGISRRRSSPLKTIDCDKRLWYIAGPQISVGSVDTAFSQ
jgi:hypothetical protein